MQKLSRYLSYFANIKTKLGFAGALKYAAQRAANKSLAPASMANKPDPVGFYDFIYTKPFGEDQSGVDNHAINWVIPDFGIGSGGHLNIFRVIKKLEEMGYTCRINIDGPCQFSTGNDARQCIRKHFFPIDAEVSLGRDALQPALATFATGWTTAYTVRDFLGAGKRYYFVQDFEPYFTALGSDHAFAEETYRFGFKGITAGDWLAGKLAKEYNMETVAFHFSYDRELYRPCHRREPGIKRVFYYARPVTPRRGFELGLLTLAKVHELNPDIEFILAGWDVSGYQVPFPYLNAGVLPLEQLPDLYSQCDIALVLSFTNLSLLPLEVMACGCAVVSNTGPNVEWLLNDQFIQFAEPTPESLSNAVISLIGNTKKLEQIKKKGLDFSRSTHWTKEVQKIADEIEKDLAE